MSFRRILPALLLLATPGIASAQTAPAAKPAQLPKDSMEIGRKYTQWFYTNQVDSLVAHMDSSGRNNRQARSNVQGSLAQLTERAGFEKSLVEEKYITRNGARQYWRIANFSSIDEPIVIRLVISSKGELIGFGMNPLRTAPPVDP